MKSSRARGSAGRQRGLKARSSRSSTDRGWACVTPGAARGAVAQDALVHIGASMDTHFPSYYGIGSEPCNQSVPLPPHLTPSRPAPPGPSSNGGRRLLPLLFSPVPQLQSVTGAHIAAGPGSLRPILRGFVTGGCWVGHCTADVGRAGGIGCRSLGLGLDRHVRHRRRLALLGPLGDQVVATQVAKPLEHRQQDAGQHTRRCAACGGRWGERGNGCCADQMSGGRGRRAREGKSDGWAVGATSPSGARDGDRWGHGREGQPRAPVHQVDYCGSLCHLCTTSGVRLLQGSRPSKPSQSPPPRHYPKPAAAQIPPSPTSPPCGLPCHDAVFTAPRTLHRSPRSPMKQPTLPMPAARVMSVRIPATALLAASTKPAGRVGSGGAGSGADGRTAAGRAGSRWGTQGNNRGARR
jgi:hypothetical protein